MTSWGHAGAVSSLQTPYGRSLIAFGSRVQPGRRQALSRTFPSHSGNQAPVPPRGYGSYAGRMTSEIRAAVEQIPAGYDRDH